MPIAAGFPPSEKFPPMTRTSVVSKPDEKVDSTFAASQISDCSHSDVTQDIVLTASTLYSAVRKGWSQSLLINYLKGTSKQVDWGTSYELYIYMCIKVL